MYIKNVNMDKKYNIESTASNKNVKNVFKKMIADKRAVQSYIREHGTLKGFKDDSIIFAKPL